MNQKDSLITALSVMVVALIGIIAFLLTNEKTFSPSPLTQDNIQSEPTDSNSDIQDEEKIKDPEDYKYFLDDFSQIYPDANFSEPTIDSFEWRGSDAPFTLQGKSIEVKGIAHGLNALEISFEKSGLTHSVNNDADGANVSESGYSNYATVCLITKTITGEVKDDGIEKDNNIYDIKISCAANPE